jgi:hypothetical protein
MTAIWLFLYVACLVRLLTLYRLDLGHPATLLLLLPILLLPWMDRLRRLQPWLQNTWTLRVAGLVALVSALALARVLNLGYWETHHAGLAGLAALLGLGLSLVAHARPRESAGPGLWLWIAAWEYAGIWHPILTPVGAGLAAFLGAFALWPEGRALPPSRLQVNPFWAPVLFGLVVPKPWFDYHLEGTWAAAMAAGALAAGLASLPRLREKLDQLPNGAILLLLALAFVAYPSAWVLAWSLAVGFLWGILWPRLPRPLPIARISLGFVLGALISFALHSNLGIPFLRPLLWWGS